MTNEFPAIIVCGPENYDDKFETFTEEQMRELGWERIQKPDDQDWSLLMPVDNVFSPEPPADNKTSVILKNEKDVPVGGYLAWRWTCGNRCGCTEWRIFQRVEQDYRKWDQVWNGEWVCDPEPYQRQEQREEMLEACSRFNAAVSENDEYLIEETFEGI